MKILNLCQSIYECYRHANYDKSVVWSAINVFIIFVIIIITGHEKFRNFSHPDTYIQIRTSQDKNGETLRMLFGSINKWNFSVLRNSTCKFSYMLWEVLQLFPPRHPHKNTQGSGWKVSTYFACPLRVLSSGILKMWKKCQNSGELRIVMLFQIWEIPPGSTLKDQAKCCHFSGLDSV